jgi:Zn-dependent oligopeptidase
MNAQTNPLLDFSDLPRFDGFTPECVTPAIDTLLAECRAVVARLEAPMDPVTWDNFVEPLEQATERLGRAWGVVGHLNAVVDTPELRAAYNENQPRVTEFWTALAQNLALFEKYKALKAGAGFEALSPQRRKIIDNALRDFHLGGADLSAEKKTRFAAIQERMAELSTRFSENVLDATNAYELIVDDEARLAGLPDDARQAARASAEKAGKPGYRFTLHFPSYFPVLQYADDRALRETIYRANATKASEFGAKPEWDNTANIIEILTLRHEEAQLLGYQNYAEVSLVSKMAETPQQVIDFLEDLARRAQPFAAKDLQEVRQFAREELGMDTVEAWDLAYVSEKLRERRYAFSEQEVKQYFPEHKVVGGLFGLVEKLFSVKIAPDQAPVWHRDVKFFRIERDGKLIGQFYLDLYARSGKRGGAWMNDARGRRLAGERVQTPVHGKLLLGMGRAAADECACRDRPAAAARIVRQDDRSQELSVRPADAAPGRVLAVRHAPAFRLRPARRRQCAGRARRSTRKVRGDAAAAIQPLPEFVRTHLLGRLCGRLLQLQVGRGTVRRRLQRLRGSQRRRRAPGRSRPQLPGRNPVGRRFAFGAGIVQGLPRPRTRDRCAATPQRHDGRTASLTRKEAHP